MGELVLDTSCWCNEEPTSCLCSFLCIRKEKKTASPSVALWGALDPTPSQQPSSSELLDLCSGKFPDTPPTQAQAPPIRKPLAMRSGTQTVKQLLGLPVELGMGMSQEQSQEGLLGLCSGLFPSGKSQAYSGSGHASSLADTSDGMSRDSTDTGSVGEEEGGVVTPYTGPGNEKEEEDGGVVMRWAHRHQQKLLSEVGLPENWADDESESDADDVDMPVIRRRKLKIRQSKE